MEIKEILSLHLNKIKEKIAERMSQLHRTASGKSVSSLLIEIDEERGVIYGNRSFLVMERGRGSGKVPHNFTSIIRRWILDKGISVKSKTAVSGKPISQEQALKSFAGAVAFNIMKKGTKIHRDKQYDDIYTSAINEELKVMSDKVAVLVLENISNINNEL